MRRCYEAVGAGAVILLLAACAAPPQREAAAPIQAPAEVTPVVPTPAPAPMPVAPRSSDAPPPRADGAVSTAQAMPLQAPAESIPGAQPELTVKEAPAPAPATPAARPAATAPESPFLFHVTVAAKDPSHPFYGVGSSIGMLVNGVQGKDVVVERGHTYTFKVETDVKHDFYLTTSKTGWGAATYSDGVKGNFTYDGLVTIDVGPGTPDLLYYQCRNHKAMGGRIIVINEGEDVAARLKQMATPEAATASAGATDKTVTDNQVKQKISFAEMFVTMSPAAKAIPGSGDETAIRQLKEAQSLLAQAKGKMAAGENAAALSLVDQSLRTMSEASRAISAETQAEAHRARYEELLKGVTTFEDSYQRNYKMMVGKKGTAAVKQIDLDAVHRAIAEAEGLAADEQYAQANAILRDAQDTLTSGLNELLADETLSYELVFETLKEEYEYELSRYLSYEELIPIAIEQKRPPEQTVNLMNGLIDKAKEIKALSGPEADKGNYKDAILMLQGATGRIQKALQIIGVR